MARGGQLQLQIADQISGSTIVCPVETKPKPPTDSADAADRQDC
jgi:hypothetical protein